MSRFRRRGPRFWQLRLSVQHSQKAAPHEKGLVTFLAHEDQLKRSAFKIIDSINLMALMCTGSGKTCYFTMYILLLLVFLMDPSIVTLAKKIFAKEPVVMILV